MAGSARVGLALRLLVAGGSLGGCRAVLDIRDAPGEATDASFEAHDAADVVQRSSALCSAFKAAPELCSDFEEGDLFAGWDNAGEGLAAPGNAGLIGGGTFEELRTSGGRMLLGSTPRMVAPSEHANAILLHTMKVLRPNIGLRASLTVVTKEIPVGSSLLLMTITFGLEGGVAVYWDSEGPAMAVIPDGKGVRIPSWPVGAARTISVIVVDVGGARTTAQMSIEGVNSPELEVPAHFANATTRRVALGPAADGPIGLSRIIIDDAVVF